MKPRGVFDTNIVVSAKVFGGRLRWLPDHWRDGSWQPVASEATLLEFADVLARRKFRLPVNAQRRFFSEYRMLCELIQTDRTCPIISRDPGDQKLLDLAESSGAVALVSGDADLLSLRGQTAFAIETPDEYRQRIGRPPQQ